MTRLHLQLLVIGLLSTIGLLAIGAVSGFGFAAGRYDAKLRAAHDTTLQLRGDVDMARARLVGLQTTVTAYGAEAGKQTAIATSERALALRFEQQASDRGRALDTALAHVDSLGRALVNADSVRFAIAAQVEAATHWQAAYEAADSAYRTEHDARLLLQSALDSTVLTLKRTTDRVSYLQRIVDRPPPKRSLITIEGHPLLYAGVGAALATWGDDLLRALAQAVK